VPFHDRDVVAALTEFLEDAGLVFFRDANTGIGNANRNAAIVLQPCEGRHIATVGRKLHRIGQKIEQDLFEGALVGDEQRQIA
jgi:hypothetical protein